MEEMIAGRLKYIIQIFKPIITRNEFGETEEQYELTYRTRAQLIFNGGNRSNENNEIIYSNYYLVRVRNYVTVGEFDRIKFNNKWYRITSKIDDNIELQYKEFNIEEVNE